MNNFYDCGKCLYICLDDVNGPGPDPKGAEEEGGIFSDFMHIVDAYMANRNQGG